MRIVLPWVTRAWHRRHASTRRAGRPPSADRSSPNRSVRPLLRWARSSAEEPFVVRSILEVAAAAEHQRLIDGSLESVMALLGVSILMGLAGVDGLSFQAVVGQQGAITLLEQITIAKIIHRGAEPIGAVHLGNSSQFPEGVLEPLAEALETLGKADCGSLPIGIGQNQVIDHVIKRFAGQRDVQVVHVREVGGSQLAGPMDLIEKDLLGWTLGGSPRFDLPLQGAELDVGKSAWEAMLKVLEKSFCLEPGIEFQQVTKLDRQFAFGYT